MNLYKGGYGQYQYYTVAEDLGMAIKQIQERYNMEHLPVTAEIIDNIEGFNIVPVNAVENKINPATEEKTLEELTRKELLHMAKELDIDGKIATMSSEDLIEKIKAKTA